MKNLLLLIFLIINNTGIVFASEIVNVELLVDAIKRAENSQKHPYGILKPYCRAGDPDGQCRKGCWQTVRKWLPKLEHDSVDEFIDKFGDIFCPVGASNDPKGVNKNWKKNVKYFYTTLKNKSKMSLNK